MLAESFAGILNRHADRVAVTDPGRELGYGELDEAAQDVAGLLAEQLAHAGRQAVGQDGDTRPRAGILAANSVGYVVWYLALLRCGAVPMLLDSSLGPVETAAVAEDCSLDLLVHDAHELGPLAAQARPAGEAHGLKAVLLAPAGRRYPLLADTEVCRFTSGSTGRPHCIEFSGSAVSRAAHNWAEGTALAANDRIACFAALSNGLAFNTSLLAAFERGASLHLTRGLPTAGLVVQTLERTQATRLVAFPALYESVVRRRLGPEAFAAVRIAVSSAAPLRPETRRAFADLTGVRVSNYYGVAETGPLTFTASPDVDGGLGLPLPGVELHAGTEADGPAEIAVRSESMGSRYLNAPGVFEARIGADGLYRTGDEGYLRGGELFLTGRTGRMINFGGRKVDPVEVAAVLRQLPGVLDAVVFEAPDQHGEPTVAAAVAAGPEAGLDAAALRAHCAGQLAPHKVPGLIRLFDRIPANSVGKPSLQELRRLVAPAAATDPTGRESHDTDH